MSKPFFFGIVTGIFLVVVASLGVGWYFFERGKFLEAQDEAKLREKIEIALLEEKKKSGFDCRKFESQLNELLISKVDPVLHLSDQKKIDVKQSEEVAEQLKIASDSLLQCNTILSYQNYFDRFHSDFPKKAYPDIALMATSLKRSFLEGCDFECKGEQINEVRAARGRLGKLLTTNVRVQAGMEKK